MHGTERETRFGEGNSIAGAENREVQAGRGASSPSHWKCWRLLLLLLVSLC